MNFIKKNIFYIGITTAIILAVVMIIILMYPKNNTTKVAKVIKQEMPNLKFSDLPENIRKNYIKKDELSEFSKYLAPSVNALEKDDDEPLEGSVDELKAQIITLRQKNKLLYEDNLDLVNKNWEIAILLRDQKDMLTEEKEKIISKSLVTINDAEQQHYKNINDLTKRINELQQESINSSKDYENKIVILENKIDKLEKSIRDKELIIDDKVMAATKEQRISNSSLAEKNRYLLEELDSIKKKMNQRLDETNVKITEKKQEISNLKQTMKQKEQELSKILTKHTAEILKIEKKNNQTIKTLRDDMDALKDSHQKEIARKNSEQEALVKDFTATKKTLRDDNLKLEAELKRQEFLKSKENVDKKDIVAELTMELRNLKILKDELEEKLKNMQNNTQISSTQSQELAQKDAEILKLKETLIALDEELKESKPSYDEQKHLKNYKFLNDKIASLEEERNLLAKAATNKLEKTNDMLEADKKELQNKIKENESLKEKIANLEQKTATLSQNQEQIKSLKKIKDDFSKLQGEVNIQEQAYQDKINELNSKLKDSENRLKNADSYKAEETAYKEKIKTLEESLNEKEQENKILNVYKSENLSLKKALEESKKVTIIAKNQIKNPKKLELIDQIQCDDIALGTNEPSYECKAKVSAFLDNYTANNYYEILPIIDNGGFATFQKIQNSNLNIPQSEIQRLSRLSNLGLGKDRAASGGKLVVEKFKDFAKVSYSVDSMQIPKKRGFVIKVYE